MPALRQVDLVLEEKVLEPDPSVPVPVNSRISARPAWRNIDQWNMTARKEDGTAASLRACRADVSRTTTAVGAILQLRWPLGLREQPVQPLETLLHSLHLEIEHDVAQLPQIGRHGEDPEM